MASVDMNPVVTNLTLVTIDQEYSHVFTAGVKHWSIQARSSDDVRYAFLSGDVDGASPTGPYMTLKSGQALNAPEKFGAIGTPPTIYFAADAANVVMEILEYTFTD